MPEYKQLREDGVLLPGDTADEIKQQKIDERLENKSDELIGNVLSSRRGQTDSDPLAAQNFAKKAINDLDEKQINSLMDSSWIAEIIVDQFSEYATRSGAEIEVHESERVSEDLASELEDRINEALDQEGIFSVLQEQVEKEREGGEGYVLPITRELEDRDWDDPLSERPSAIESWNVFGKHKVADHEVGDDVLDEDYNELQYIKVNTKGQRAASALRQEIHPSRFTALVSRKMRSNDNELGLSVFRRMVNILKSIINAEWSVGQIIFSMVFKVLKTDISGFDEFTQQKTANRMLEDHYNALSLAMIDRQDELEVKGLGQGVGGIGEIFEFLKDLISASTKTPKTILFGNNSGTIAGSEQDEVNYFSRISNFQGTYLTPQLRWIVDLMLRTRGEGGIDLPMQRKNGRPVVPPSEISYSIEWDKIFELTERERAEIDKLEAQTQQIKSNVGMNLANLGAITPGEIPEKLNIEITDSEVMQEGREAEQEHRDKIEEEIEGDVPEQVTLDL